MSYRLRPLVPAALVLVALAGLVACSGSPAAYTGSVRSASTNTGGGGTQGLDPGPGQAFVTGTVERFVADDAQPGSDEVLATPFTITARERGTATVVIQNALVGGTATTISWNSGTPLPIDATGGGGGLELGVVHVEVDGGGVTWGLDGGSRPLRPGTYRAAAPVAVGGGRLAAARDAVDFTADARTTLAASGGVLVHVGARRLSLQGPGRLSVSGTLAVRAPHSRRTARTVVFGPGPFQVTLTPTAGGVTLDAVLQGSVTAT